MLRLKFDNNNGNSNKNENYNKHEFKVIWDGRVYIEVLILISTFLSTSFFGLMSSNFRFFLLKPTGQDVFSTMYS